MTKKARIVLKEYFETGDIPTQSEFSDLIDSQFNLEEDYAASIHIDTTNFDNNLSANDDNVQKALDTIDDLNLGSNDSINIEVLTADKTLTISDAKYQLLSSNDARNIYLPTNPPVGTSFFIKNDSSSESDYIFNIYNHNNDNIDQLHSGSINSYIWQGSCWEGLYYNINYSNVDFEEYNTRFGYGAHAITSGTAFGYKAEAVDNGVSIGHSVNAGEYSVTIGYYATCVSNSVAIGCCTRADQFNTAIGSNANTYSGLYSNAIGYYSKSSRSGEFTINIDGAPNQKNNHGVVGLTAITTNNTSKIMLAGGVEDEKLIIRANSIMTFDIQIAAIDNTTGDCAAYQVTGAIKRDGSNNTTIVGSVTKTVLGEDDASWDVAVTADDTNEALQIEVTGDNANTVQWVASVRYTETHF